MLNTRHLETLCRIAATGSFSEASEELNIPLSTLSMQMKALETVLDAELFDRTQRPPALTPLGRRIAEKARDVITAESGLLSIVNEDTNITGSWRLGMVATASVRLLPSFLKQASIAAPNARFTIETALSQVLEARVLAGQIDAAIVSASDQPPKGLSYLTVREEPLVFALPPDFGDHDPDQLAKSLPFLQFDPGSGIGKQVELYMEANFPEPDETITLDSIESIMECVNEGLGFTLLSEADARRYGHRDLEFNYPKTGTPKRTLALAWAERSLSRDKIVQLGELFM